MDRGATKEVVDGPPAAVPVAVAGGGTSNMVLKLRQEQDGGTPGRTPVRDTALCANIGSLIFPDGNIGPSTLANVICVLSVSLWSAMRLSCKLDYILLFYYTT